MKRNVDRMLGSSYFDDGLPIYVNRVAENFDLSEHTHDFIELTYIGEGSGVHYIGEESLRVSQGDVFFIPVGTSHVFRPSAPGRGRELIVYNCLFPTTYVEQLETFFPDAAEMLAFFREPQRSWLRLRDPGEFREGFKELFREYAARLPGCEAVLTAMIVRMLVTLHRHSQSESLGSGPTDAPLSRSSIEQAVRDIEERYADNLTVKELAAQVGLGERQFSRLFAQRTGMNFSAFLQNTRVEAACTLLSSSHRSIPEIAAAVGYSDMKFFYRLFKRKTGETPLGYRKSR
ncbi:AraC family transcriptional regulator [Saccharibacillus sacchari]|uniref:AraC family transcriptional regulator n=1 Tax=Saccharibacillus sacchari TaxID=456493 RepID=A0ACC6PAM3_9BACL